MKKTPVLLCLLLGLSMITVSVHRVSATPSTSVAVDPPMSIENFLSIFSVEVNVTNVTNFACWQLNLYYLSAVLNCTDATEGSFLNSSGSPYGTFFSRTITNNYNSTCGCLSAYSTILGLTSVNGSGVILIITFKAVGGGSANLTLDGIKLGDEESNSIPYVAYGGAVNVIGAYHDVAVTNVTSFKTVICRGFSGNVAVTTGNLGGYVETFNLTVYANTTSIASQNVTLSIGNSATVSFVWNTTGLAIGNYTLSAYAWPVPGETLTSNNNFTGGWVFVSIPVDLTGGTSNLLDFVPDGLVDMKDVAVIAGFFIQTVPPAPANVDITGPTLGVPDGIIDMMDVGTVASHFLEHYP